MRIGIGFDVHAFTVGRPLVLGGVKIPYKLGLAGHSDADVLLHAVADALLGAAAEHDLGYHFPDTDSTWAGISSGKILERVGEIIGQRGYRIVNVDSVVIAQRPKLSPYIEEMRLAIASALNVTAAQVSVKATTTEKLGFTGRGEGIAAKAICLLD
ncbi:MAG TPA: 2-C-methyl-D-erythritol 2,4-cyclodiphosphate synthase [Firmicutes bacterium]|jgi:2-C-methyl-D-erythritol 2,4-cyclodiphosphate synthase|nr:2-C-methyl-D-erythritol 2,4-cyclodiphosphate synthase [Bacillota bacterium]